MLLILFGLPGAGKTYAARVLHDVFDFQVYEADDDIPEDYRRDVAAGLVVGDDRRDAYHRVVLERIADLLAHHDRLAVAVPLLRDKHRLWIRERFPEAVFVLVECDPNVWPARVDQRQHTVRGEYARKVLALYEPPSLEHFRLDTTEPGPAGVRRQLAAILAAMGG
jgi:gluconate kinase